MNTSRIYIGSVEVQPTALPRDWDRAWGEPSPFHRHELATLQEAFTDLADGVSLVDESLTFGPLVHAGEMLAAPVHRWYYYKEAFSPRLPGVLVGRLGAGRSRTVADVFAGVGTTPLALRPDPRIVKVIGVEYSPFAHFVGQAKLGAKRLDAARLRSLLPAALAIDESATVAVPELATFHNEAIFARDDLRRLLLARARIDHLAVSEHEHAFFRLGLAAAAEYLSQTIKDGRALRIVGYGHRKRPALQPRELLERTGSRVADAIAAQWTAMIEDLEDMPRQDREAEAHHLLGDARDLADQSLQARLAAGSVGLCLSSPPYLNCIDYSEVYKIELWLLGFISSHEEFRTLRLGTIRSHPSIDFPERPYLARLDGTPVSALIDSISSFVERNHARAVIGRMIRNYFGDMARVLEEQYRILEPGGHSVLIVGNSTFSRRGHSGDARTEHWRIPILSDVILARIGEAIGFSSPEIWTARDLRARNVTAGSARESLVVLRKPLDAVLRSA